AEWLTSLGKPDPRFVAPELPVVFPYAAEYHPTSWITRHALEFLERRDPERPYFAVVSYAHPHSPYDPPEPYASHFDPVKERIPADGIELRPRLPAFLYRVIFDVGPNEWRPSHVGTRPKIHTQRVLA